MNSGGPAVGKFLLKYTILVLLSMKNAIRRPDKHRVIGGKNI